MRDILRKSYFGKNYEPLTQVFHDKTSAIIPELSVDVPIANTTNAYLTGG